MRTIFIVTALLCLATYDFCAGFQIFLKKPSDAEKTVALKADGTTSVKSLKRQIEFKEGTPTWQQQLMYSGKQLEDGHRLAEYGIQEGATLQLGKLQDGRDFKLYLHLELALFANKSDTIEDLKEKIVAVLRDSSMRNIVFDQLQHNQLGYLRDNKKTIASCGFQVVDDLDLQIPHEPLISEPSSVPTTHHREPEMDAVENSKNPNLIEKKMNKAEKLIAKEINEVPVVMYSKTNCRYCTMAKDLLAKADIPYRVYDLDAKRPEMEPEEAERYLDALVSVTAYKMVPQVFICGKFIGGYTELDQLHKSDSLKGEISKCQG